MPSTLIATAGADDANVYLSDDDALTYFDDRPNGAAYTDASDEDRERALLWATRTLDALPWKGVKGETDALAITQALAFPRRYVPTMEFDSDFSADDAVLYYADDTIPRPIKDATCELALELLRAGTTDPLTTDATRNVKREVVAALETEYFDPQDRAEGLARFPRVMQIIRPLLRVSGGLAVERV